MTKQDKIYSDLIQHPIKNVNDYPYDDLKYGMLFIDTVNNTVNLCENINSENRTIKPYNDGIMYDKDYLNFENRKFMLYNIIANLNLKLFPLDPVLYLEIDKINYIQSTSSKYFEMYKQKLNEMFKTIIINRNMNKINNMINTINNITQNNNLTINSNFAHEILNRCSYVKNLQQTLQQNINNDQCFNTYFECNIALDDSFENLLKTSGQHVIVGGTQTDLINFNDHFNALLYIENYIYESEQDETEQDEINDILEYFNFNEQTKQKIIYWLDLDNN